jgi:NAD(P)-dependent dehydrogenase (short-subunit alcohol dehydrogenase family)
VARDPDRLAAAAGQLRQRGVRVLTLSADTTDDKAVRAAISQVAEEFGGVDILVDNAATPAGASAPRDLTYLIDNDILAAFDTKVLGYLRTARAAAPHMIAQGWGRIINVSGLAARSVGTVSGSVRNVAVAELAQVVTFLASPRSVAINGDAITAGGGTRGLIHY